MPRIRNLPFKIASSAAVLGVFLVLYLVIRTNPLAHYASAAAATSASSQASSSTTQPPLQSAVQQTQPQQSTVQQTQPQALPTQPPPAFAPARISSGS